MPLFVQMVLQWFELLDICEGFRLIQEQAVHLTGENAGLQR
jgi:hypothetical protein